MIGNRGYYSRFPARTQIRIVHLIIALFILAILIVQQRLVVLLIVARRRKVLVSVATDRRKRNVERRNRGRAGHTLRTPGERQPPTVQCEQCLMMGEKETNWKSEFIERANNRVVEIVVFTLAGL